MSRPAASAPSAGIAVRLDDKELRGKRNAAIDAIRANGVCQKVNAKYFAIDIYEMR